MDKIKEILINNNSTGHELKLAFNTLHFMSHINIQKTFSYLYNLYKDGFIKEKILRMFDDKEYNFYKNCSSCLFKERFN